MANGLFNSGVLYFSIHFIMKYNILMAKRYIVDKDDKDKSVEECDDNMPIVSLLSLNTWGE